MFKKIATIIVFVFLPIIVLCQTQPIRRPNGLMYISPGYLGPNALPVPPMYNGMVDNKMELEFAVAAHLNKDDKTQNIFTRLFYPIANGAAAIDLYVVPLESFQMTDELIAERKLTSDLNKGMAGGDIYFSTIVQLLKGFEKIPDVTISLNCRTASGTNLINGRFTDTPGYWFDITMGKTVFRSEGNLKEFRLALMGGFYAWQTYRINPQNDAALYGIRSDFNLKGLNLYQTISGYSGRFKDQRDDPLVYRLFIEKQKAKSKYKLTLQQGLHDFNYTSIMLSWSCLIKIKALNNSEVK